MENKSYLREQLITYLGNKRSLLFDIERKILYVKKELQKEKLVSADLFAGSGIVSRLLKVHSSSIVSNDLENYAAIIGDCYLSNKSEFDLNLFNEYLSKIETAISSKKIEGIFTNNYAPRDDNNILEGERAFYTHENALILDSYRYYIEELVPSKYHKYFLAPLLSEASIHVNTCGVFKGFYKDTNSGRGRFGGQGDNALKRITSKIAITAPVLSNNESEYKIYQEDAVILSKKLKSLDLVYLDPPYNQHPYGSNYFMLNLIVKNKEPKDVSKVSGIPKDWNRSDFNKKATALKSMEEIIKSLDAKFVLISYNNEGFISFNEMNEMLARYGTVKAEKIKYTVFRGSRNIRNRSIDTKEYLFLLRKEK